MSQPRRRSRQRAHRGGQDRERECVRWLEDLNREPIPGWPVGWLAVRRPPRRRRTDDDSDSGSFDVMAILYGYAPRLIEVKSTMASPFSDFGPERRALLLAAALQAGAEAWLCWWPYDGQGPRWFASPDWPQLPT